MALQGIQILEAGLEINTLIRIRTDVWDCALLSWNWRLPPGCRKGERHDIQLVAVSAHDSV